MAEKNPVPQAKVVSLGITLCHCLANSSGNFAIIVALLLPVLLGLVGAAVDLTVYTNQVNRLQDTADSAALAAAKEAALEGWSQTVALAVATHFVDSNLRSIDSGSADIAVSVNVDKPNRKVSVTIDQDHFGYFVIGYFKTSPQIRVNAVAQSSGSVNICVIGLGQGRGTVGLQDTARISASNCAVYSNSTDPASLRSVDQARLVATLACSAGGFDGSRRNFSKTPVTDCPVVADPLASRPPPAIQSCPLLSLGKILEGLPVMIVEAGTHCGGLKIKGITKAIFAPGIHVFKDGPLIVSDNATVDGLGGVGLYFTGDNAYFEFTRNARVDLQAPTRGAMAGLLTFQDRKAKPANFIISSDHTRNLIGTIYLSQGNLVVDATNDVGEESAYTAIVVRQLSLKSGPNLVLNTDYDATKVPVPDGLGPSAGSARLTE